MEPEVSVILPFYNAERTLYRAVSSIADQDQKDFECLLVDNNSTDRSREIAQSWAKRDPRFRLISESRQGVMFASNAGAAEARGRYMARMDADDVAHPERLRRQRDFLDRHISYGAVAGLVRYCPDHSQREGFRRYVDWSNSVMSYEEISTRCFIESPIVNPTAMWRKEIFTIHGGYREGDFPEDYELWLRWLDEGVRIVKIPEIVLDWYDSDGRLTRTDPRYRDQAFFRVKSEYLARWLLRYNRFHPRVMIWGASRISRRRASFLEELGIKTTAYIDIKHTRQLDRKLIFYRDLPPAGDHFILSYIRQRESREIVVKFLEARGYREGFDYLLVS